MTSLSSSKPSKSSSLLKDNNLMLEKLKTKLYNFLRWSEKYTKTDMVYLASGGFWLSASKVISLISSLLLAIAYARLLPPTAYGTYKYILSIASLISIASLPGLNTALINAIAQGYEGTVKPIVKTKIKFALIGSTLSLLIAGYYFYQGNYILALGLVIVSIFTPLTSIIIYGFYLQGKKDFKRIAIYNSIHTIILTFSLFITILLTNNVIIIITVNFFISWIVKLYFNQKTIISPPSTPIDQQAIRFGKHLSLIEIINSLARQLDKILIWHFLGASSLALYAFAVLPIEQLRNFLKLINKLAQPKLAGQNSYKIKQTLVVKIIKSSLIFATITTIYIGLAPFLYKILFPQYQSAAHLSQLFAIVLLFVPWNLTTTALIAKNKHISLYKVNTISSLIKITLLLLLTPLWGIIGTITALIISTFLNNVISFILFKRELN